MIFESRPPFYDEYDNVDDKPEVKQPPMIVTSRGATIILDGKSHSVAASHPNYILVIEAIKEKRWEDLPELVDIAEAVKVYVETESGNVTVSDGIVQYTDPVTSEVTTCDGYVVDRILQFMSEGIDAEPLLNFLDKLMKNNSFRVIQDLYTFLSNRNMPLDADGDFYGYKAIRNDWMDKHSGTISNRIGEVIKFTRRDVDDNPQHDCSYGLHVGSIQYVKSFACSYGQENGDRIIIVKVNPADVVAVPEYDTTKLRCCKYEVISEYTDILPDTTWEAGQELPEDEDTDEIFDEDDDDCYCPDCGQLWDFCYCGDEGEEGDDGEEYPPSHISKGW